MTDRLAEIRERLDEIGPPWGNPRLLARDVEEAFAFAYELLDRLVAAEDELDLQLRLQADE